MCPIRYPNRCLSQSIYIRRVESVSTRIRYPIRSGVWSRENRAQKVYVLKSIFKVCVLWLPRYFRYSIEPKWVEFTRTKSDRSFTGIFKCVLRFLQHFKESKEKKTKSGKRRVWWNTKKWEYRRENICDFWDISKTK